MSPPRSILLQPSTETSPTAGPLPVRLYNESASFLSALLPLLVSSYITDRENYK
jgi:hypothetical protein